MKEENELSDKDWKKIKDRMYQQQYLDDPDPEEEAELNKPKKKKLTEAEVKAVDDPGLGYSEGERKEPTEEEKKRVMELEREEEAEDRKDKYPTEVRKKKLRKEIKLDKAKGKLTSFKEKELYQTELEGWSELISCEIQGLRNNKTPEDQIASIIMKKAEDHEGWFFSQYGFHPRPDLDRASFPEIAEEKLRRLKINVELPTVRRKESKKKTVKQKTKEGCKLALVRPETVVIEEGTQRILFSKGLENRVWIHTGVFNNKTFWVLGALSYLYLNEGIRKDVEGQLSLFRDEKFEIKTREKLDKLSKALAELTKEELEHEASDMILEKVSFTLSWFKNQYLKGKKIEYSELKEVMKDFKMLSFVTLEKIFLADDIKDHLPIEGFIDDTSPPDFFIHTGVKEVTRKKGAPGPKTVDYIYTFYFKSKYALVFLRNVKKMKFFLGDKVKFLSLNRNEQLLYIATAGKKMDADLSHERVCAILGWKKRRDKALVYKRNNSIRKICQGLEKVMNYKKTIFIGYGYNTVFKIRKPDRIPLLDYQKENSGNMTT